jgi:ATP-dependent DNA helicase RecQ
LSNTKYLCGHNIFRHDLKYIQEKFSSNGLTDLKYIDTLILSPLLFPQKPYHHLLKDDKLQSDELNNPVNDSKKAKVLFLDEINAFKKLDESFKTILYIILQDEIQFKYFFEYISYSNSDVENKFELIYRYFDLKICEHAPLESLYFNHPVELAYCLALINTSDRYSITPPWVLSNFPEVERIMYLLRNKPCLTGCKYCDEAMNTKKGLKDFFRFDSYREFNGEPLQEKAVKAAVDNKSLLAVFPTGGGKSLTFQVPALMAGRNSKGLTVVISPLQSLMKDQVDNLEEKGITDAVTINGLLDPIERGKSFERVEDGSASILYISPESLRSKTIERCMLGRNIVRFVIDEAHCFSSWGQDFRVDYQYIGDFIKQLQEKKNLDDSIPVSCFTATAKQKVIEDICKYFEEKLDIELEVLRANASRTNLTYKVYDSPDEEKKYNNARLLIESKNCPTIIYVSRTRKAYQLSERLNEDGFNAKPYHGKMDVNEKTENQDSFMSGETQIMVATSAFGMGVDKKDVGMVIHYEISDSLENYVQEAGRAGRDENISAECFVLFNEEDLNKHFILLNQTKISIKEIQQIWRAIKYITKYRASVSNSALEIARKAGWDENVVEIETRVITAVAALEHAGYLKRGQNIPRVFANSILSKNAQQAIEKINGSERFTDKQKVNAVRIIKKLFSAKSRKQSNEESGEARVDYISDHLGIVKEEVIRIITLLREEKILADAKDLTAFIKSDDNVNQSLKILRSFAKIENFLVPHIQDREIVFNLKELNENASEAGLTDISPKRIRTILNFWSVKNWIKRQNKAFSNNHFSVLYKLPVETVKVKLEKRHALSEFIVKYLFNKAKGHSKMDSAETLVEFSVHELKNMFEKETALFKTDVTIEDIEDTLFYLSRIEAIKIEGGFLVVYNRLTIDRLEENSQIQYKKEDYKKLDEFYKNRMQQIHIVGEYAKKMLEDYEDALRFVEDYFQLNYSSFLNKYFPGSRIDEIKRNITPKKFKQLFDSLSPRQLKIINEQDAKYITVAAGPGSGKTKVLVHKLASLLLMEDVKHEQLLMLTFSRAAAVEFKKRLISLIGNAANFIEIKTFHSYCFDLLGRVGCIEKSERIISETIKKIESGDVEQNKITKTVLVIDEAQDMDENEFGLVKSLMDKNVDMRVIAVGDDDQNIYTFRGADSKHFIRFIREGSAKKYELVDNFRSKKNLVDFTNHFVERIKDRFKSEPIIPFQKENGQIRIYQYNSDQLIVPVVENIGKTDLSGTTGILTKTNDEALRITGLLLKRGIKAKLIQSNDGFNLFNVYEIRSFFGDLKDSPVISKDAWDEAKRKFIRKFQKSSNYELCKNLIVDFQKTNPKVKYRSDFEVFIKESKLEDFIEQESDVINVSTIHKAKGKEFDNVFIVLDKFNIKSDDNKRQLYVAMTRAKQNLTIHYNSDYFQGISTEGLEMYNVAKKYQSPEYLLYHLSHRDIYLGYFEYVQRRIDSLLSGESLLINNEGLANSKNEQIIKFSKAFQSIKAELENQDYKIDSSKINFILYWKNNDENEADKKEIKIVLPEVCFKKNVQK